MILKQIINLNLKFKIELISKDKMTMSQRDVQSFTSGSQFSHYQTCQSNLDQAKINPRIKT